MFRRVSFRHGKTPSRGAAVLSLPVTARREDTLALEDFRWWIVRHIDNWFAFVRKLRLGIEHMEDTVLVTGCDLARSWTNIAFLGGQDRQVDSQVSFGVKVEDTGSSGSINFRYSPENAQGAVLRCGPEGSVCCTPFETINESDIVPMAPLGLARESMCIHPRISCCSYLLDIA